MNPVQWYVPVEVAGDLGRLVACAWTAVPTGTHRLTPDGCVDMLRTSNGRFVVCGPERRSWQFRLPDHTTAVGLRFRPGALRVVFGIDVASIADRTVALAEVAGDRRASQAEAVLAGLVSLDAQRGALVGLVGEWALGRRPDPVDEAIVDAVVADVHQSVGALAASIGMSTRTLHRHCTRSFGYGAATLGRIVRFQRLLAVLHTAGPSWGLAAAAASAGYCDQAHLSGDCRAITGLRPGEFMAEWFPTFPDMSDPYKTRAPLVATIVT